jgi:hypothetical protein
LNTSKRTSITPTENGAGSEQGEVIRYCNAHEKTKKSNIPFAGMFNEATEEFLREIEIGLRCNFIRQRSAIKQPFGAVMARPPLPALEK